MPLPPIPGTKRPSLLPRTPAPGVPAPRPAGQNPAAPNYDPMSAVPGSAWRPPKGGPIGSAGPGGPPVPGSAERAAQQARAHQMRVMQELQRQAAGDMNSQSQQQLRQGFGQAMAQQSSLGSTMRGQSAGAAMRGIRAGQQGIQRGLAGEEQMLKVQEQEAARSMLAQMLAQQHEQDMQSAGTSANTTLGNTALGNTETLSNLGNNITNYVNNEIAKQATAALAAGISRDEINRQAKQFNDLVAGGASALAAYDRVYGGGSSDPSYRQVDGQNSIVPAEDK